MEKVKLYIKLIINSDSQMDYGEEGAYRDHDG
jgi:hypothetical protein